MYVDSGEGATRKVNGGTTGGESSSTGTRLRMRRTASRRSTTLTDAATATWRTAISPVMTANQVASSPDGGLAPGTIARKP